ncbi:hypothetical protein DL95DRAFT_383951, partial [Leptodontidium sp. 2 PMI_412]
MAGCVCNCLGTSQLTCRMNVVRSWVALYWKLRGRLCIFLPVALLGTVFGCRRAVFMFWLFCRRGGEDCWMMDGRVGLEGASDERQQESQCIALQEIRFGQDVQYSTEWKRSI